MASQGPRYPATITTEVGPSGDNDWTSPANIGADDNTLASITHATFDAADTSYRLKAQNFGFTIPAGSTIDGIVVEIERSNDAGGSSDNEVRLYDAAGVLVGDNKAVAGDWATALTIATYGGATDTWTASPTVAMVNDADFGVALIVNADAANTDIAVDYIRVTVHYTEGPVTVIPGVAALTLTTFAPTVFAADNAYEEAVFADSPTFVASMEEASGNLADLITGKVGTANGTPTYGVAGPISGKTAIDFSADTQFFTFDDHIDLDLGNVFSVEAWLRRDTDTGGNEMAVAKLGGGAYGLGSEVGDRMQLARVGVETVAHTTATNPADATWDHWVVTHSATGTGNTIFYLNGTSVAATDGAGINNALVDTTGLLVIGREAAGNRWDGAIAYVALYKTVLTAARITAHFDAASGSQLVTPGVAALTTATFAPTVSTPQTVTPTTAGLALTALTPSVVLGFNVVPTTTALATSTFAPTVTATAHQTVTPGVAALVTATFAPAIAVSDHQLITPITASLATSAFVPVVTASDHQTVTPGLVALALTAFAPTATVGASVTVTPGAVALALSTFAPTVAGGGNVIVLPGVASLALAAWAPDITTGAAFVGGLPPVAYARGLASRAFGSNPVPGGRASNIKPE